MLLLTGIIIGLLLAAIQLLVYIAVKDKTIKLKIPKVLEKQGEIIKTTDPLDDIIL